MIESIHPHAWAIGPTYVYIHVSLHRLAKIAVNHFNQPYRVTYGVWDLTEPTSISVVSESIRGEAVEARIKLESASFKVFTVFRLKGLSSVALFD